MFGSPIILVPNSTCDIKSIIWVGHVCIPTSFFGEYIFSVGESGGQNSRIHSIGIGITPGIFNGSPMVKSKTLSNIIGWSFAMVGDRNFRHVLTESGLLYSGERCEDEGSIFIDVIFSGEIKTFSCLAALMNAYINENDNTYNTTHSHNDVSFCRRVTFLEGLKKVLYSLLAILCAFCGVIAFLFCIVERGFHRLFFLLCGVLFMYLCYFIIFADLTFG